MHDSSILGNDAVVTTPRTAPETGPEGPVSIARAAVVEAGARTWTFDDVLLGTCPWCDAEMDADATICPQCGGRTTISHDRLRVSAIVAAVIIVAGLAGWGTAALVRGGSGDGGNGAIATMTAATTTPARLDAQAGQTAGATTAAVQGPPAPASIVARNAASAAARKAGASKSHVATRPNAAGVVPATKVQAQACATAWNHDAVARTSLDQFVGSAGATVRAVALQQPGKQCRFSFALSGTAGATSVGQVLDYVRTPDGFKRTPNVVTHSGFADDTRGITQPLRLRVASDGAALSVR